MTTISPESTFTELLDTVATATFGITTTEALEKEICIDCKEPAMLNCHSQDGVEEYRKSGLCEKCFDIIMSEAVDWEAKRNK